MLHNNLLDDFKDKQPDLHRKHRILARIIGHLAFGITLVFFFIFYGFTSLDSFLDNNNQVVILMALAYALIQVSIYLLYLSLIHPIKFNIVGLLAAFFFIPVALGYTGFVYVDSPWMIWLDNQLPSFIGILLVWVLPSSLLLEFIYFIIDFQKNKKR